MNELITGSLMAVSIIGMFCLGVQIGRRIQNDLNGSFQDYWIEQYSKLAKENMELKLKIKLYEK